METCENCGQSIGKLETPWLHNEHIVCEVCWNKLSGKLVSSGGKNSSRVPASVIAGIVAAVVGCLVLAVAIVALIQRGSVAKNVAVVAPAQPPAQSSAQPLTSTVATTASRAPSEKVAKVEPPKEEPPVPMVNVEFLDFLNLEIGQVGKVHEKYTLTALSVLQNESVLVTPIFREDYVQMQGFSAVMRSRDHRGQPVMFRGISTSGIVDGKVLDLSGEFHVVGTDTYTAANHAKKTVFVIKPTEPKVK